MSEVDQKIVSMRFEGGEAFEKGVNAAISVLDKLQDSLKFTGSTDGIEAVQSAVSNFNMDSVETALDEAGQSFSIFKQISDGAISYIGEKVVDLGISISKNLVNSLTKSARDGFGEYETQMKSVQTILSNAGDQLAKDGFTTQEEKIGVINETLDELNTYADKTIYNFSEMTRNIGTFTAAGVDLQTATKSIQGIANLAAASGSSSQQASTAMYQLSQAISTGALKLQDWNSVVNAGMGGTLFQDALKRTARAHGVAVDEMIEKNGSFRESLQEGWVTSDILTETLEQLTMSTEGLTDAEIEEMKVSLENQGYSREDAEAILDLANNAQEAATKVRTWTQLWDTVGEAMGSGWSATWRIIVGDFLEATDLFTFLSDKLSGIIGASADARNKVLEDWAGAGGRTALVDGIKFLVDAILSPIIEIGHAFSDVFGISAEQLYNITTAFATFAEKLVPTQAAVQMIYDVFYNVFTIIHSVLGVVGNLIRVFVNVAKVAWNVVRPIAYLAGGAFVTLLDVLARVASSIHTFSDGVESVLQVISKPLGYIAKNLSGLFISFGGVLVNGLGGALSSVASKVVNFASKFEFLNSVIGFLKTPVDTVVKALYSINSGLVNLSLGKKVDVFKKLGLSPEIMDKIADASSRLSNAWKNLKSGFDVFKSLVEGDKDFSSKISAIEGHLEKFWDLIKGFAKSVYEMLPAPLQFVVRMFRDVADAILSFPLVSAFKDFFADLPKIFIETLSAFKVESLLENKLNSLAYGFDYFKDRFLDFAEDIYETAPDFLQKGVSKITSIFKELWTSVKNFVTNTKAYSMAKNFFTEFFGADILKDSTTFGDKVVSMIDTIKRKFSEFRDYITSPDFNIVDFLKSSFGKAVEIFKELTSEIDLTALFSSGKEKLGAIKFGSFGDAFSGIFDTLRQAVSKLSPTLSDVFDGIVDAFSYGKDNISKEIGKLDFSNISTNFELLVSSISKIPDKLEEIFSNLKDTISGFFKDFPWPEIDQLKSIAGIIGKLGILVLIGMFVKSLKDMADTISKIGKGIIDWPKNFGNALGKFGEGFNKWRQETKADAVLKIAGAIAIMAASLFVIASLPADDLIKAGKAIGALALGMGAFIAIFGLLDKFKVVNASAMNALGTAMLGLGVGVLALSGAVLILSQVPIDTLDKGLGACVVLIITLAAFAKGLGGNGKSMLLGAAGMIIFAKALDLMVGVVKNLQSIDLKDWAKNGLGAFVVMVAALAAFGHFAAEQIGNLLSSFLKFGAGLLLVGLSIGVFAINIMLLAFAINSLDQPIVVLGVLAGFLIAFTAICFALKDAKPDVVGAALMKFALAIGVLALALTLTSMGNWADMLVAGGAMVAMLGIFAAMVHFFEASDMASTAKSILIFSAAVGVMAVAITYLAATPWQQLLPAVAAISALILAFALLANFTKEADMVATSSSLLIFAAAIGVMAMAFKLLESVNVGAMIGPLVVIGVAFAALAIAGNFLLAALPGILGIAAAFLVFSMAIKNLAEAFGILTGSVDFEGITAKFDGLKETVKGFFSGGLLEALSGGIASVPGKVSEFVGNISDGFLGGLKEKLGFGSGSASPVGQIGTDAVNNIASGVTAGLPTIGTSTASITDMFSSGISGMPDISTGTAQETMESMIGEMGSYDGDMTAQIDELMANFDDGFAGFPPSAEDAAGAGLDSFISEFTAGAGNAKSAGSGISDAATNGIEGIVKSFGSKGQEGVDALVKSLKDGTGPAENASKAITAAAKKGLGSLYDSFYSVGRYAGLGLYDGLNSMNQRIKDKASEIARNVRNATENTMEVASPSKVMYRIGRFIGEGLVLGMASEETKIYKSSEEMAGQIPDGFNDALTAMSVNVDDLIDTDYNPVITPVIDPTQFDSGMGYLNSILNNGLANVMPIGDMDYNAQFGGKLDDLLDSNRQVAASFASNSIDYTLLGVAVANALIQSGVHVEMDGGELMGYLAGQIQDTRRMYS